MQASPIASSGLGRRRGREQVNDLGLYPAVAPAKQIVNGYLRVARQVDMSPSHRLPRPISPARSSTSQSASDSVR